MPRKSLLVMALSLLVCGSRVQADEPTAEQVEFFEKKIRPVLAQHCAKCHSSSNNKAKGGLRLDSRADLLKGGDSGPAITPGSPDKSKLVEAISYKNTDLLMPPKGRLPDAIQADLAAWIKMGAPWPGAAATPTVAKEAFDLLRRKAAHWCWQPIRVVEPPQVRDAAADLTSIDRFLLARLQEKGLTMAPAADKRTLLRRITFDLIGLPPRPEEVEEFLRDERPDAFARVVDRLLASPHFGERWGRHWLDLVRYAESRGHEFDPVIPNAWQYRDYVIRALNSDVPYNQFVLEHLAGDLVAKPRLNPQDHSNESILGTGFWHLGEEVHSPVDIRADQADRYDNRIDVMTKTFLGLTVSCARCHDHKFDAISANDYYSLFAFLESTNYRLVRFDGWETNRRVAKDLEQLRHKSQPALKKAVQEATEPLVNHLADYLLLARTSIQGGVDLAGNANTPPGAWKPDSVSETFRQRVANLAKEHKLDPDLALRVTIEVLNATNHGDHLLHAWGLASRDKKGTESLPAVCQHIQQQQAEAERSQREASMVVDYRNCPPSSWLPDDVTFGTGPRLVGEIEVSGTPEQPLVRVTARTAASYDRVWDRLSVAPGTQNDHGSLGSSVRAGRTLHTPTFTIQNGTVWYLVRGAGLAYAAVGNHTLIAGPLHGGLVQGLPAGNEFHWVGHSLAGYKGQKTHIEFTADGGSDFAVAMVIQADRPPSILNLQPPLLGKLLEQKPVSVEELANRYQTLAKESLQGLATEGDAQVVNLMLRLTQTQSPQDAAAVVLRERDKLAQGMHAQSRLALALQEGTRVDGNVFIRGSHKAPGEVTSRRFLEALEGKEPIAGAGSGRLTLAQQMLDPARDPLIGRVAVNRIWHHLFGQGLVASVDNFGVLGEAPSHPELLDTLADEFVREGWSIKKMIRRLVLTRAYQMSSRRDVAADQTDPQDRLLHRMRVRRLEGEVIRDSLLTLSGSLNPTLGGPPVPIHLTPFLDGRGRPASGPLDGAGRRSIYLSVTRNFLSPLMLAFDTPSPFSTVGRRTVSNVPAQALIMLNDPFVHQQTDLWGKRILAYPGTTASRIDRLYEEAFGRSPSPTERTMCQEFLEQQAMRHKTTLQDVKPWAALAHTLVNVKEFIYLQ